MKVLSVDQALGNSGVCVRWDAKQGFHTESIKTDLKNWKEDDIGRKMWIAHQIYKKLKAEKPDLMVMEEYARSIRNSSSLIPLVELGAYIKRVAYKLEVPLLIVTNGQLSKFACGKGNAKKDIIIKECFKRWEFDTADNNQADSFILGLIGWYHLDYAKQGEKALRGLIQPQREVILALAEKRK